MQILMHIDIRHDPATEGIVFQIVQDTIHLIHHALFILMFHAKLVTVSLSDGSILIRPLIPNMAVQIVNVVGLALPDPKDLIRRGFKCSPAQRHDGELLRKIIPVHHAEFLDRIGGGAVRPMRPDLLPLSTCSILQNILAHIDKYGICVTHIPLPVSSLIRSYPFLVLFCS